MPFNIGKVRWVVVHVCVVEGMHEANTGFANHSPATYLRLQTFPPACGSVFPEHFILASLFNALACIGFTLTSASGKIWCTRFVNSARIISQAPAKPSTFRLSQTSSTNKPIQSDRWGLCWGTCSLKWHVAKLEGATQKKGVWGQIWGQKCWKGAKKGHEKCSSG